MPNPRVLILRAPGTNCDEETSFAFERAGAQPDRVHINRLLEDPALPDNYQILCLPGGFSYGDDVAAGRILANQIRLHLGDSLRRFQQQGKLVLGICNGFQVLIKSGVLLADDAQSGPVATLTWNDSGHFEDRWVHLNVGGQRSPFLAGVQSMYLPVAHAEGKFVVRREEQLQRLNDNQQLAVRYASTAPGANGSVPYPENPNGSILNVAGVCDETGRVLGLMPHPERHIEPTQHPRWTRGEGGEVGDGMRIFRNAVDFFA